MVEIIRGTVIQSSDAVIENGAVAIEHDEIIAVGTWDNISRDYDTSELHGSADHVLIPGFVNTHSHAVQTLFRGAADDRDLLSWLEEVILPGEATLTEKELVASCRIGYGEMLLAGITTTNDMLTANHSAAGLKAAEESGIRGRVGKMLMDRNVPDGLLAPTDEVLEEAHHLADLYPQGGRIQYSYAPRFIPTCSDKLMAESSQAARERGLMVHTHASENQKECAWVEELTGESNIHALHQFGVLGEHTVLAHGIWTSETEMKLIADTGTSISHNPTSNAKLGSGIAPVPEYLAQGTQVGLATDGSPATGGHDFFLEMKLSGFLQKSTRNDPKVLPARTVFNIATAGGAQALNYSDIGKIEVGYKADLVLLNPSLPHAYPRYDPFSYIVYTAQTRDIQAVWVNGNQQVSESNLVKDISPYFDIAQSYARDQPFLTRD
jgi:cytosine/adenosine deaminase-related metal-dependent hydrolase